MANYKDRIYADPAILNGKPIIKGTRITVEQVLVRLSEGLAVDDILNVWPHLAREDILAAIAYSAEVIAHEELLVG